MFEWLLVALSLLNTAILAIIFRKIQNPQIEELEDFFKNLKQTGHAFYRIAPEDYILRGR